MNYACEKGKLDYAFIYLIDWCNGSKVQFPLFLHAS